MEAEMKPDAAVQAAHAPNDPAGAHQHVGHVVPLWILMAVAGVLLVLTWLTVAVTAYDFGPSMNLLIAMAIALVKALLVALFFMHLWWDRPINGIVFIGALFFVSIFVVFALMDKESYEPNIAAYWAVKDAAPKVESWETAEAKAAQAKEAAAEHGSESATDSTPASATEPEAATPEHSTAPAEESSH
jgi:cytochrome c oxidase subunit 4